MHLQSSLVQNLYYFKIRSHFEKLVQNFELKWIREIHLRITNLYPYYSVWPNPHLGSGKLNPLPWSSTISTLPSLQQPTSMPTRSMNFFPACSSISRRDIDDNGVPLMSTGQFHQDVVKQCVVLHPSLKPQITKVVVTMTATGPIKHNWRHIWPSQVGRQQSRHSIAFTQWLTSTH